MSNWFNIRRFGLVLRHEFVNAWIELSVFTAITILTYLLQSPEICRTEIVSVLILMGWVIYMLVLNSRLFVNMQKPTKCLSFLTLPASNAEKFYARFVLYWVYPTLLLGVLPTIFVSDICWHVSNESANVALIVLSTIILIESVILILSGTIFRRFGFIITVLIELVLILVVVNYVIKNINDINMMPIAYMIDYVGIDSPIDNLRKLSVGIFVVFAVFNIGLARMVFSRKRLSRALINIDGQ